MTTIEIDFDVYKELTVRRKSEETTYNDVIRELLGLSVNAKHTDSDCPNNKKPWICKGVTFPHNTKFRSLYKNQYYYGKVVNGSLIVNGKTFNGPSPAAMDITNNNVNGWNFWECKFPGYNTWKSIKKLRK